MTSDEQDALLQAMNNAALAKQAFLTNDLDVLRYRLDGTLSWCTYLLGVEHPMLSVSEAAPDVQGVLLDHGDIPRLASGS